MLFSTFYRTKFLPKALLKKSTSRVGVYDLGARLLEEMKPRIKLLSITEKTLSDVYEFGLAKGHSRMHMKQVYGGLRLIVRAWNPEALDSAHSWKDELPPPEDGTARACAEHYIQQRMVGCKRGSTSRTRSAFTSLREHYGRDVLLSELSDSLAADHFQWLLNQGMPATTINSGHRATLFAVWNFAVDNGWIQKPPRIKKLKENRSEPDALSEDQVRRLFETAELFHPERSYNGVPSPLFWSAILRVLWWTGLRRSSLLGIDIADVNLETGQLTIPPERMKNKRGKTFMLGADAVDAIRRILVPARQKLFDPGVERNCVGRHLRQIMLDAGIRRSKRRSGPLFHLLRRTVATHVAMKAGIHAASTLMGHSSEYVTKFYIDPSKMPGYDARENLPTIETGLAPSEVPKPLQAIAKCKPPKPTITDPWTSWEVAAQASELLAAGWCMAAGMMARRAIEMLVTELLLVHQITQRVGRGKAGLNLHQKIHKLYRADVIDLERERQLQKVLTDSNRLAHGQPKSRDLVADVVLEVNSLLQRPENEKPAPTLRIAAVAG